MSTVGTAIPGEKTEQHNSPQVNEEREAAYVAKAQELGWRPEEEWTGDPSDWVPAKEFVGRQKLYDRIHSLKNEVVNIKRANEQDMAVIKQYVQQMSEIEYKRALADLTAQRKTAVREADVEAVENLDSQIDELKDARKAAPTTTQPAAQYSPQFLQWVDRNVWYKNDPELKEEADALGVAYTLKYRGQRTEQDVMNYVETQIKRLYPEKFPTAKKPTAPAVEEGSAGNSSVSTATKKTLTERDLSEDELKVYKALVGRKVITKEKFFQDLAEAKAR